MASYVEELFSLDGLVAVVTGGSSGIGRAIAGALARAGGSTVVVARGEDRLAATVDALTADGSQPPDWPPPSAPPPRFEGCA